MPTSFCTDVAQKRAEILRRLERAAEEGAVTAMRVLHLIYDKAEAQELHGHSGDNERRERAEVAVLERPSKKALEQRAALSAGEGTDWGDDLMPPADWRRTRVGIARSCRRRSHPARLDAALTSLPSFGARSSH